MNVQLLPASIANFFDASNNVESAALHGCFTENASVQDEGHIYQGREAILAWLREAQRKYAYSVFPLSAVQDSTGIKVLAKLSGQFPGSLIQLNYIFRLAENMIDSLEIQQ